jgi:sugar lactone lactonase YvrE
MRARFLLIMLAAALMPGVACRDDAPRAGVPDNGAAPGTRLAKAAGASQETIGDLEVAALFRGPMPTGAAVSKQNRLFVNFPRWGDPVEFTVAEVRNGRAVPFPDEKTNLLDESRFGETFISVQSVVCDEADRLWVLDTGSINFGPVKPGGAKLIAYSLQNNTPVKKITFPADVCLPTTYLNDVRFDLNRGEEGMAFITDSSGTGPNGIIVVDLASGRSWRKLHDHPSTKAEPKFTPVVEGEPLMMRPSMGPSAPLKIGADGIAITPDGQTLYYCPLSGHHLYSVPVDALADQKAKAEDAVKDLGDRGFASDGLACGPDGQLYLTDYENNAIRRMSRSGQFEFVARDPRAIWPDSIAFGPDGRLYFTANQLNRQKQFHYGKDLRQQPYVVFRFNPDGSETTAASE